MTGLRDFGSVQPGDDLPTREFCPGTVQCFLFSAAIWNPHKIHFDHVYTTQTEGHTGLITPGPLLGDFLAQVATDWVGESGSVVSIEYSNRRISHVGERLRTSGTVQSIDMSRREVVLGLSITNDAGEVKTQGVATVRFSEP
jgi:3-methylfumaryl-CoA hydratase